MNTSFDWLGRFPLAVDLADTVRVIGTTEVDLLTDDAALSRWVTIERPRAPETAAAVGRLADVKELRGLVRALLFAAAEGRALPEPAREAVNRTSALSPVFPVLVESGDMDQRELTEDAFDRFRAAVARSAIELLAGPQREQLSICRSSGCGMLFVRTDGRRKWCSAACGNRARVARHASRRRAESTTVAN